MSLKFNEEKKARGRNQATDPIVCRVPRRCYKVLDSKVLYLLGFLFICRPKALQSLKYLRGIKPIRKVLDL